MPYPGLFKLTAGGAQRGASVSRSGFFSGLDRSAVETLVAAAHATPAGGHSMIQLRPLGGAMARVPASETAFAHRGASLMLAVNGGWSDPADEAGTRESVGALWQTLQPKSSGVYVNFLADDGAARIREAYPGPTYEHLVAVKRRYDPSNVFSVNQNIHPGT
jgi:hypothetical protein